MVISPARFWVGSAGGLLLVGVCAGGVLLVRSAEPAATPTVLVPAITTPAALAVQDLSSGTVTVSTAVSEPYRDGRFTVTGRYLTPGGDETIGVTLDLAGGVVTAADVRTEASSPTARQFQDQFGQYIAGQVVARDLASLSVARVAGASLTSVGFNDALNRIRSQAHR